ncbi:hypothetical protein G8A07_15015 [Roseateles sp. DAIF2]|uniref:M56 family metallopeptidase n=1 Tax=Roseateles sp. DAIF2 TaxID=2714952 RepID=UPI0018A2A3DC|nr:M56 family metallopeptidase [Roseateles sp. DAIF2]QPF74092.1 hypothetical protein G8A07_15015 [Roseateles sp. DAIF2]
MSGTQASWPFWAQLLSETLLQLLWQLGLLGALVALLLWTLPQRIGAQGRYALCAAALLLSLLLAGLQLGSRWSAAEARALPAAAAALPDPGHRLIPVQPRGGGLAPVHEHDIWPALTPWRQGLALAWLGGIALMALRLLGGLGAIANWRRASQPAPAAWQRELDRWALEMGLRLRVGLRLLPAGLDAGRGPFTVGWWRPVVLVPAALLSGLPAPLLEALLVHELAHVRRWDYLANLLQRLVEVLLFFHPVVWWLSHRMRIERELVADAIAARQLGSAERLARALQALAELPQPARPPSLAAAAQGGELVQRVRALMRPAPGRPQTWVSLACVLLLSSAALLLWLLPPTGLRQAHAAAEPARPGPRLPADLALASRQVLVMDADSGVVLLARDAQQPVPVASISKLLTALVVLEAAQDLDEDLLVTREEVRGSSYSSAALRAGQRLSRASALTLMLQASDNRAALLLARLYPGGPQAFERAAQEKAQRLGLRSASLRHPSGAPDSNRASAVDVARLLEAAQAEPLIRQAAGSARAQVLIDGQPRETRHSNPLVGAPGWPILLSKTGASDSAGRCVALQLREGGRRLSIVLLGAPDAAQREADLSRIRDALQG